MENVIKREREFLFAWRIENYSFSPAGTSTNIISPEFITQNLGKCKWYLMFFPRGSSDEEFVSCYLHRSDEDDGIHSISIDFKLSLLGDNETVLATREYKEKAFKKGDFVGENKLLSICRLKKKMKNLSEDVLIIQCHMSINSASRTIPHLSWFTFCEARTRIGFDEFSIVKNVKYPLSLSPGKHKCTLSGTLHSIIDLCIQNNECEVNFRIKNDVKNMARIVKCQLFVLDSKGAEIISKSAVNFLSMLSPSWDFTIIFSTEILTELASSQELLLKLVVSYSNCIDSSQIIKYSRRLPSEPINRINSLCELQKNMVEMFNDKKHCDVRIRVDSCTFLAHKCVLASRSPVFSAMFDHDMLENITGMVNIRDTDAETLHSLLKFIYAGAIDEMDYKMARDLFIAADKYQISSLKEDCFAFLKSVISQDNVCELILISDLVKHADLKDFALNYLRENSVKILSASSWASWSQNNAKLASESLMCLSLGSESSLR